MLSRLVITFLPRSKHLLISWLQSPSAVILSKWVSEVAQSCLTLCNPMDCSPPGSSNHGILQARILEWVAIWRPPKIKSATVSLSICHQVMGPGATILVFWILSFKPTFSLSSSTFIKMLFSSSSFSAIRVVSSAYLRLLIFLLAILIPLVLHPVQHFSWCTPHISKYFVHVSIIHSGKDVEMI